MPQRLKNLMPTTDSIAEGTNKTKAPVKTTVSHSKDRTFSQQWQQFVKYAKYQVPHFEINATNQPVLEALLTYFLRDGTQCQKLGIALRKGILLLGPVGCGKTTAMQLFAPQRFQLIATRDVARKFLHEGHFVLECYGARSYRTKHCGYGPMVQYDQPITYCFDDLGVEQNAKRYGNDCNVMAEILLDRYDQFVRWGMLTHLTTNLNADELEQWYGDRVRSRLREMFNLICFPPEAPDRRK